MTAATPKNGSTNHGSTVHREHTKYNNPLIYIVLLSTKNVAIDLPRYIFVSVILYYSY